jgi:anti-anti-sigma regulatory factor
MRLVSNQPAVSRIVAACGLSELLPVDDSVDAALSMWTLAD